MVKTLYPKSFLSWDITLALKTLWMMPWTSLKAIGSVCLLPIMSPDHGLNNNNRHPRLPYAHNNHDGLKHEQQRSRAASIGFSWTFLLPWAFAIIASILIHWMGLVEVWKYRMDITEVILAVLGSVSEGTFCLLLLHRLAIILQTKFKSNNKKDVLIAVIIGIVMLLINLLFVTTIHADLLVHRITEGFSPDIWIIRTGVDNAKSYFRAKIIADAQAAEAAEALGNSTATKPESPPQLQDELTWMICMFTLSIFVYTSGQAFPKVAYNGMAPTNRMITKTFLLSLMFLALGAWIPTFHTTGCVLAALIFSPKGHEVNFRNVPRGSFVKESTAYNSRHPNVIYVIPDSSSGKIMFHSKGGKQATPFIQSLRERDDFYFFENARSVSGFTQDGFTSLITGCQPVTEVGRNLAFESSIGTEFRAMGYQTFSSSSEPIAWSKSPWYMMQYFLENNMDEVVDAKKAKLPVDNFPSSDDRGMFPYFESWLKGKVSDDPFYAQHYLLNQHFPFFQDANSTQPHRYFSAMETFDEYMKNLFQLLNETGKLENTVIVVSSDHGDHLDPYTYRRNSFLNDNILNVVMFMYIPRHLFKTKEAQDRLRYNTKQTTSILDVFPTLQHILYGGSLEDTALLRNQLFAVDLSSKKYRDHCFTGIDLLKTSIPDNRIAPAWNKLSNLYSGEKGRLFSAFAQKDTGIFLRSLSGRESTAFFHEINFTSDCVSLYNDDCVTDLTKERRLYWQKAIRDMPTFSDPAMQILMRHWKQLWQEESDEEVFLRGKI